MLRLREKPAARAERNMPSVLASAGERAASYVLVVAITLSAGGCSLEEADAILRGINQGLASGSANLASAADVTDIPVTEVTPTPPTDTRCSQGIQC